MSIATEIQRLQQAKADIKTAIENKGVTVGDGTVDTFASKISEITGGGGSGGIPTGYHSVTFMNGDNLLFERLVLSGDDCPDPLTQGRIETPTKESTVQYHYTYSGWSEALTNITEDKVIYATFTETIRKYTVTFYDTDGTTVLNTQQVAYGGSSTYTYKKDNHIFLGWTPEPTNITSDLSCYGAWQESYSFADASWEYIAQMSESGQASQAFAVGDERTESGRTYVIADFNYDILADDNSKTAGITIITKDCESDINYYTSMYGTSKTGWITTSTYKALNTNSNSVWAYLPESLKSVIKPVRKKYRRDNYSTDSLFASNESLWLLSAGEIGTTSSQSGYTLLERSQDRAYKIFDNTEYIRCTNPWWTRTVKLNDDDYLCGRKDANLLTNAPNINSAYIRFGFCI